MKRFFLVMVAVLILSGVVPWKDKGESYRYQHLRRVKEDTINPDDLDAVRELIAEEVSTCEKKLNGILVYYNNVSSRWRKDLETCCIKLKQALADFLAEIDSSASREDGRKWEVKILHRLEEIRSEAEQMLNNIIKEVSKQEPKSHTLSQVKNIRKEVLALIDNLIKNVRDLLEEL